MSDIPRVWVGVIVVKEGKVLLWKRKGAHGEGSWSFPGGHLEFKEDWVTCAKRETLEETGVEITNVHFGTATNDVFEKGNKHYITIFMVADHLSNDPKTMEPNKFEKWEWFEWDELPEPLFVPIVNLKKTGWEPSNC